MPQINAVGVWKRKPDDVKKKYNDLQSSAKTKYAKKRNT
jgi:hypothetical protein